MDMEIIYSDADLNAVLRKRGFIAYDISTGGEIGRDYKLANRDDIIRAYSRKHFYKICIVTGRSLIEYSDRSTVIDGTTLFFGNPHVPYSWECLSDQVGYCCLFTEDFFKAGERSGVMLDSPVFNIGGTPIFSVDETRKNLITYFLRNMVNEQESDYIHKNDMFRSYINLILHEARKMHPSDDYVKVQSGPARLTSLFLDLLERQFPVESVQNPIGLKNPKDFADSLFVHVNYLNRAVKQITGKPTSVHIAERIVTEGKILLQHTNWTIAEIGYALGFEYPSYFNEFFKKVAGVSPSAIRV
jgi:AraC-like DNA-binding protein